MLENHRDGERLTDDARQQAIERTADDLVAQSFVMPGDETEKAARFSADLARRQSRRVAPPYIPRFRGIDDFVPAVSLAEIRALRIGDLDCLEAGLLFDLHERSLVS